MDNLQEFVNSTGVWEASGWQIHYFISNDQLGQIINVDETAFCLVNGNEGQCRGPPSAEFVEIGLSRAYKRTSMLASKLLLLQVCLQLEKLFDHTSSFQPRQKPVMVK